MTTVVLPPGLARLLWEYPVGMSEAIPDEIIFAKVMERGTIDEGRWLLGAFPSDRLATWFDHHALRHLSPRSLRLWACLLERPLPTGRPQVPWIHA